MIDVKGKAAAADEIERARLAPDDPLVDQMKLHVRALAPDAAGVEHLIARLEQLRLASRFDHHAGGVIADDFDRARIGSHAAWAPAARDLIVDGVD